MNDPEAIEVEPQWQRPEPSEVGPQFTGRDLPHSLGVLVRVLLVVRPQVLPRLFRVWGMKSKGIEFVVTHNSESSPGIDHGPDDLQRLPDLWASIDEVAEKDGLTLRMPVDAFVFGVPELGEKLLQGVSVAVDVTD